MRMVHRISAASARSGPDRCWLAVGTFVTGRRDRDLGRPLGVSLRGGREARRVADAAHGSARRRPPPAASIRPATRRSRTDPVRTCASRMLARPQSRRVDELRTAKPMPLAVGAGLVEDALEVLPRRGNANGKPPRNIDKRQALREQGAMALPWREIEADGDRPGGR